MHVLMLNTQQLINDFKQQSSAGPDFNYEFPTLYMYALYICGGDFSMFDDLPLLELNIQQQDPEPTEPDPNQEPS